MTNDVFGMTKKELLAIEERKPTSTFNAFVIVPTGERHDSGYECMKFILTDRREIVGAVGGSSDVVHLNGIGGYGENWAQTFDRGVAPIVDWSIDLLPKSHCVRVFCSRELYLKDGFICSDFEVYARERK